MNDKILGICFRLTLIVFFSSCSLVPEDRNKNVISHQNDKVQSDSAKIPGLEIVSKDKTSTLTALTSSSTAAQVIVPEDIFPNTATFLPRGVTYNDVVPDTFDLAERAARYIPGVIKTADPNQFYAPAAAALSGEFSYGASGPRLVVPNWGGPNWGEVMLALAQAREMTGYDRNNAAGTLLIQHMMLINMLKDKNYSIMIPNAGTTPMVYAMQSLIKTNQQVPSPRLTNAIEILYQRILSQFVTVYNSGKIHYGFFADLSPFNPDPHVGYMGPMYVPFIQGTSMIGFLELEKMKGLNVDPSIRVAVNNLRDLVLNLQGSYLWASPDPSKYYFVGAKGFAGHMYSWLESVRGVLMSARALQTTDPAAASVYISFCRDIYNFVKTRTNAGWVGSFGSSGTTADMIIIGLLLTELGAGNYLDEIDAWARNQMAQAEIDQRGSEYIPNYNSSDWSTDHVGLKTKGLFFADATHVTSIPYLSQGFTSDDHAMSFRGLYEIWKNIITTKNTDAFLNLFMNYSGKNFDIKSDVPYQGRVEILTKKSLAGIKNLYIHIPTGTDLSKISITQLHANGTVTTLPFTLNQGPYSRYLLIKNITANSKYVLKYPLWIHNLNVYQMRSDSQMWYESSFPASPSDEKIQYWNASFRGGTIVKIHGPTGSGIPRYAEPWRLQLFSSGTSEIPPPKRNVTRFVYGGNTNSPP